MATNANLPAGQFITSLGGKRCTAIPKTAPAAAQPTTALPGTPPVASQAAPSPTDALPTPAAPVEAVPPLPPAEEAPPAATSPIPPPADDTDAITTTPTPAAGAPATEPTPSPSPSPSPGNTDAQDGSFIEAAPSTPSQSEEASPEQQESDITQQSAPTDTDVAPTSTVDEPAPAATETDLGATAASDSTAQTTPTITAADSTAVSTSIPSTLVSSTTAAPPAQNTAGLGAPSNPAEAAGADGPTAAAPFNKTMTTAAVAGGVVGGLAILSLIAFLIFFLRRRSKRRRRSTLLTSMFGDPGFGRGEKGAVKAAASASPSTGGAYTMDRTSLGPTPASEKLKNTFVFGFKRFRGRLSNITRGRSGSPHPTVDLDRGTSQFGPPQSSASSSRSRSSSRASRGDDDGSTAKGRFFGWWGRPSRSSGGAPKSNRSVNEPFAEARAIRRVSTEILAPIPQQPDFNMLLKMDEEAALKAASGGASMHRSTMGPDHFLSGLGFDYVSAMGAGPFSDDNAIRPALHDGSNSSSSSVRHDSATIPPLAFSEGDDDDGRSNPFSDVNAVGNAKSGGPTNYVQDLRRSRGRSATTSKLGNSNNYAAATTAKRSNTNNNHRRSSSYGFINNHNNNNNRESRASIDSVDMVYKRNTKFRSDPFDLDRPELLSAHSSRAGSQDSSRYSGTGGVRAPPRARAHSRGASSSSRVGSWTSEYSGISEEDDSSSETALAITTTANTLANARARASASANVVNVKRNTTKAADAGFDGWSGPGPDVGRRPSRRGVGKAM